MIQKLAAGYSRYFKLFLLAMLLFTVSRIIFAFQNPDTFPDDGFIGPFIAGIRYDLAALGWLLLPITIIHIYPASFVYSSGIKKLIVFLFVLITGIALLTNYADTGWFSFQRKRSTADVFSVLGKGDDLVTNLPSYIASYFHLFACWIVSVMLLMHFSRKLMRNENKPAFPSVFIRCIGSVAFLLLSLLILRGGAQLKPLSTQTAATYYGAETAPLILNTPYSLIKSIGSSALIETKYFTETETEKLFPIHHRMQQSDSAKRNIVVIILESFSHEYVGRQFTPFLDSLGKHSIRFTNAYANAKRSIEGLPAILTSVPALMDEPFITSQYNTNRLNSIAGLLKKQGYHSSFFHGGKNGTMGFDNFVLAAGYDVYYGKSEFEGPAGSDDGNWGIFDHAFYDFMIRKLTSEKQPFHSVVFTLSSHHPYPIPPGTESKYPEGPIPILKSIAYADDALRGFFKNAANESWFNNTVFILTADHTGPAYTKDGGTATGIFRIPLLIYAPGIEPTQRNDVAQQIDILPTALHYAGYSGTYSSMGRNLAIPSTNGYAINYNSAYWQYISNYHTVRWDGENTPSCDETLAVQNCNTEFNRLKAALQQYRHGMIHNKFSFE